VHWERPERLFARHALTAQGWQRDVLISIKDGSITEVAAGTTAGPGTPSFDLVLPGIANVHCHAFQRAMAGLTERGSQKGQDNFWSWREVMYAFTRALTPEHLEIIARALYIELLEHGYTAVGEFHYLHHDPAGNPYAAATELSDRVIAAAQAVGIYITHLPVLYEAADFGGIPPREGQRRFVHTEESFLRQLEALVQRYKKTHGVSLGVAPHSLRAVKPASLKAVLDALPGLGLGDCPIHIHVAEQQKEVADCLAWSGKPPIAWLLEHMSVNNRWCLIHATQATPVELKNVVQAGAAIGLCPTTEANLGDGVFPAESYLQTHGCFGIGSDSNVCVSPFEELRLLEYSQRLTLRRRAVLSTVPTPSVGRVLYERAAEGGAQALGLNCGASATGRRADLVALALDHALLAGKEGDRILDTLIFALPRPTITDVFVAGRWVVHDGRHVLKQETDEALRKVLEEVSLC
jgi:formimidoylglutamate deiminase